MENVAVLFERKAGRNQRRGATADTAFDALFAAEVQPMVRLATLLCGSHAVAEDIVSEAFAQVLVRFERLDRPGAYLRRCVVNGCIAWRRRAWREVGPSGSARDPVATSTDQERAELADALATLPPRQRAAVVLRHWAGLSEVETAEAIGCRVGTVGPLVHRGLKGLRVELCDDTEKDGDRP